MATVVEQGGQHAIGEVYAVNSVPAAAYIVLPSSASPSTSFNVGPLLLPTWNTPTTLSVETLISSLAPEAPIPEF